MTSDFFLNTMDVYICCIIFHYGLENGIDIWSLTTLAKTTE